MRMGSNGQCFFVDPGCRGPDCKPVTTGCAGNAPLNSEGHCPTPPTTGCTGGKELNDNACRCAYGKVEDKNGNCQSCPGGTHAAGNICVPNTKKPPPKRTRRTVPNPDNPPSQPAPNFQIQIGPGFPGGGRPGGGKPGGGTPKGGGSCLNRSCG
jgi:hypothetical protein